MGTFFLQKGKKGLEKQAVILAERPPKDPFGRPLVNCLKFVYKVVSVSETDILINRHMVVGEGEI